MQNVVVICLPFVTLHATHTRSAGLRFWGGGVKVQTRLSREHEHSRAMGHGDRSTVELPADGVAACYYYYYIVCAPGINIKPQ